MTNRAVRMALVAGTGYLLGRRRNLRLVLALGAAAAAGRLSGSSRGSLRRGAKALGGSKELSGLTSLGAPLVAATKVAATSAVTRRIDSLCDGLRDRAELLRRQHRAGADEATEPPRGRSRDGQAQAPARRRSDGVEADDGAEADGDDFDDEDFDDEPYDEDGRPEAGSSGDAGRPRRGSGKPRRGREDPQDDEPEDSDELGADDEPEADERDVAGSRRPASRRSAPIRRRGR
jgi:hypothetical protein